jgi:hypothetical protein
MNFLPGRRFESLEDMNQQAFQWATVRMEQRPAAKTRLIPAKAFEHEQQFLVKLPPHLPPPYLTHERGTDQYGYTAFDGNFYWVPGTNRDDVKIFEYGDCLKIYQHRQCVVEYSLPADGVKNKRISPEGMPEPSRQPKNRKRPTQEEEKRLCAISGEVARYLKFAFQAGVQRHRFVRELFALSCRMPQSVFIQTIERALRYQIADIDTLHRIARLCLSQDDRPLPGADVDESFRQRETYQQGSLTDTPDFSLYDKMLENDEDDDG